MRPSTLVIGSTMFWTIRIFDADGALIDADSNPTVAVRKNGAATADSVTVTKRAATTGIYDCSYNPAGEAAGDIWTIEESVLVGAAPSSKSWECTAILDLTSAEVWDYDIEAYYVGSSAGEILFDLSEELTGAGTLISQIDTTTGQMMVDSAANQIAILARLQTASVSSVSTRPEAGLIEVTRGVDYHAATIAGAIELPIDSAIDLTGTTNAFIVTDSDGGSVLTKTATIIDAGLSTQRLRIELDAADLATESLGAIYEYLWTVTNTGGKVWKPEWGVFDLGGDVRT